MPEEHSAFADIYRTHLPAVSSYLARRVEREHVEDLAADVFAIAWRRRASVTPGEELPWLYRIASYQVSNHRRRLAVRANALALLSAPDSAPAADAFLTGDPELGSAWQKLQSRHREVLGLVVLDGLPVSEAATVLGVSANAASIRLHRAKHALAELLADRKTGPQEDPEPAERSGPVPT